MSGSLSATASNASLLNGTGSVGFTTTGSFTTMSGSVSTRVSQIESVYATTGSNSFRATQSITGSLTVTDQIIAQTLNVQQVTSSIVYSSGSNNFGCDLNSRQTFTGSVIMTGSLIVNTTGVEFQVNNNGVILGNLSTDNHTITGSLNMTGSLGINAASSFRFNGVGDTSHAVGYDATVDGAFLRGQNGIRLITGGGSGIERMRISSAGTASFTSNTLSNSADAATINLKQNSTTANTGIYLERSGEQKGYYMYVGGSVDSLTFQRNNAGTKSDVMTLTRDGCVGIGTTNPNGILHVEQCVGGESGLRITNSQGASSNISATAAINFTLQNGAGGSSGVIKLLAGKETDHQGANVNDYFALSTTASDVLRERLRITAAGIACFSCQICAAAFMTCAGGFGPSANTTTFITTLPTANAMYIMSIQPELGSGGPIFAFITSRTNSNPATTYIVCNGSCFTFQNDGFNICVKWCNSYSIGAAYSILRML